MSYTEWAIVSAMSHIDDVFFSIVYSVYVVLILLSWIRVHNLLNLKQFERFVFVDTDKTLDHSLITLR